MKLAFYRSARMLCSFFRSVLCCLFALSTVIFMTCGIVPVATSLFIDFLQFTEDATLYAVLFMGGVPMLYLVGMLLYGTVRFLNWGCRGISAHSAKLSAWLSGKIESAAGSEPAPSGAREKKARTFRRRGKK